MKKKILALTVLFAAFALVPGKATQPGLLEIYAGTDLYDSYHSNPGDLGGGGGYDDGDDGEYYDDGNYDDSGDDESSDQDSVSDNIADAVFNAAMSIGDTFNFLGDWLDSTQSALSAYRVSMEAYQQAGNASRNEEDFSKAFAGYSNVRGKYEALGGR